MNDLYNQVLNDNEIINIYNKIHEYEDEEKGWAYHDYNHVLNVSRLVEEILTMLNYDSDFIFSAKIACILHDTGALQGKDNHAFRSYVFAKEYFKKNHIIFDKCEQVLEAIKLHSDGFDTNNIIALALILADKLDVKKTRVAEEGKKIIGNRQFLNIEDITIKKDNKIFVINFKTNGNLDIKELNEYYFTKKIFKAIDSFFTKINQKYIVTMDLEKWIIEF